MLAIQSKMARAALDLGVRDLAQIAKVSPDTIARLERGRRITRANKRRYPCGSGSCRRRIHSRKWWRCRRSFAENLRGFSGMAYLPFTPNFYKYGGRDERKRQRVAEKNRIIEKIIRRANEITANNPDEDQQILYGFLAIEMKCDEAIVRDAFSGGGYNGISFRVTADDRQRLEQFKSRNK